MKTMTINGYKVTFVAAGFKITGPGINNTILGDRDLTRLIECCEAFQLLWARGVGRQTGRQTEEQGLESWADINIKGYDVKFSMNGKDLDFGCTTVTYKQLLELAEWVR